MNIKVASFGYIDNNNMNIYDPKDLDYIPLSSFLVKTADFSVSSDLEGLVYSVGRSLKNIVEIITGSYIHFYNRYLYFSSKKGYEKIRFSNNMILDNKKNILFIVVSKNYSNIRIEGYGDYTIAEKYYSNLEIWIDKDFSTKYPVVYKDFMKHILNIYSSEIDVKYLKDIKHKIFKSNFASELYSDLDTVETKLSSIRKTLLEKLFTNTDSIDEKLAEAINSKIVSTGNVDLMSDFGITSTVEEQVLEPELVVGNGYSEDIGMTEEVQDRTNIANTESTLVSTNLSDNITGESIQDQITNVSIPYTFIDDLTVETVPISFIDDLTPQL